MSYYPARINEHFLNPRNTGEVSEADAEGEAASLTCGAILRLTLKIEPDSQLITDARFKATGCGFLIASASVLTETVKELAIGRAATLPETSITDWFDEFPQPKSHCAQLARDALLAALKNYHSRTREEWAGDEALICTCFGVSELTIEREIQAGSLRNLAEVTRACNAGGGCGSCHPLVEEILEDYWREVAAQIIT